MNKSVSRYETATAIDVTPPTVSVYIRRGWLRGVLIGRRWRISAASVQHLLRHGTPPSSGSRKRT